MQRFTRGVFSVVAVMLLIYALVHSLAIHRERMEAEQMLTVLNAEESRLRRENEELSRKIQRAGDADTIAGVAREELGLVLPEDRIYIVENADS